MGRVLRIGHRGAAGHAPENTLPSIEKAISLGADLVEIDVQRTNDGHLVIIHDPKVDRTTNGAGLVASMSLSALRDLDAGAGQCIPTVQDVLQTTNGRVGLILELKVEGLAEQVGKCVDLSGFTSQIIYASFLHDEVRAIKEADPQTMTMALFGRLPKDLVKATQHANATHIGFNYTTVTRDKVEWCHQRGLVVFVYTVNDRQDIDHVRSLGVDGIISDFPDRI